MITVSKSMRAIAVYADDDRYVLEDSARLLARAHQALGTLERYKWRLDEATARCRRWRSRTAPRCGTSGP